MGWSHVEGADEDPSSGRKDYHLLGRTDFQQTLLHDRLEAALCRLNRNDDGSEWLDDRRINQAISQIERPTAKDFIAINEELHDRIVRGVNVSGPDGEHERRVRFIGFEPGDQNEFIAVNQFRVDPPGAIGDRGFIVPDIVLFVNGLPLVVIEAKTPAVTDPIAIAIDQMRRYANRRIPEKNRGRRAAVLDEPAARRHRLLRRPRRLRHGSARRLPAVAFGQADRHRAHACRQ